jgi:hypothetical protein
MQRTSDDDEMRHLFKYDRQSLAKEELVLQFSKHPGN